MRSNIASISYNKTGVSTTGSKICRIHIHESNKCADEILSTSKRYRSESEGAELCEQESAPQSGPTHEKRERQLTSLIPDPSQVVHPSPITLKGDHQSSIALVNNPVLQTQTKHIDIQHHYIRDEVTSCKINLVYTATIRMLADGLTKLLSSVKLPNFIKGRQMEYLKFEHQLLNYWGVLDE